MYIRSTGLVILTLLLYACIGVQAQQRPQYTQYIFNGFLANPAVAGIERYVDLKMGARSQWQGVDGAPQTLTNAAGCTDETSIIVEMYEPLTAPFIPDTVICTAEREVIHIVAPPGYAAYYWNGSISGPYFDISSPGSYTLQVEDENGCTTTATFEVRPYCKEIIIPNTFSPNGDGVNDVWVIGGLEEDIQAQVAVFNRNGQEVFRSRGYATPWNGTYKGQRVPVGAYYYTIITTRGETLKGSITVLY
ncbi:T9SS type B sorting domain-containing protein [Parapedobacter tibetensis]|uniref:T9SS type B sorting domain-containing protein n=1 Tax=Parapedobacter tibetensis TaxID=2972951 RepID=UPI00214DCA6B|nr:gliding motility-associated C-terminal domain-containing protein [Parapedobacter tibetensis]